MTREECTELARKYGFERVATLNNGTSFLFMDDNCINLTINIHGDFMLQYKTKENFILEQDWWGGAAIDNRLANRLGRFRKYVYALIGEEIAYYGTDGEI